jgi:hypothetical protein
MNPGDDSWIRSSSCYPYRAIFNKDYRRAPSQHPRGTFGGSLFDSRVLKDSACYVLDFSKASVSVCGLSRLQKVTGKHGTCRVPDFILS